MPHVQWFGHQETLPGTSPITWPGTIGPGGLAFNPGDWVYVYRGSDPTATVYSEDGSQTFTVGAYLPAGGTTPVYLGSNTYATAGPRYAGPGLTLPYYWDGPYFTAAPGSVNLSDPELASQIEWIAFIGLYPDPNTGEYPITFRSGRQVIYGEDLKANAVSLVHLHPTMVETGNVRGGVAFLLNQSLSGSVEDNLVFIGPLASTPIEWATGDGSGDISTELGGQAGGFALMATNVGAGSDFSGYETDVIIAGAGATNYVSTWPGPSQNPSNAMIAFCQEFPGSSSQPTLLASGSITYAQFGPTLGLRYCFWQELTLNTGTSSQPVSSYVTGSKQVTLTGAPTGLQPGWIANLVGGPNPGEALIVTGVSGSLVTFSQPIQFAKHKRLQWGQYSQMIETPLSTVALTPLTAGSTTNALQFTVPNVPSGWFGFRLYYTDAIGFAHHLISSSDYTITDNGDGTSTVYLFRIASNVPLAYKPSYGFSAWPSGTLIEKDPAARAANLMKWAHVSTWPDPATRAWTITGYHSNVPAVSPAHVPVTTMAPPHLQHTGSTFADSNLVAIDASNPATPKFKYVAASSSGSSGLANPFVAGNSAGQLIYSDTDGVTPLALPASAKGAILSSAGPKTPPHWSFAPPALGSIPYYDPAQPGGINWLFMRVNSFVVSTATGALNAVALANYLGYSHSAFGKALFNGNGSTTGPTVTLTYGGYNNQTPFMILAQVYSPSGGGALFVASVAITESSYGLTSTNVVPHMSSVFVSGTNNYGIMYVALWP